MALVIDTGVLFASLDRGEAKHFACRDLLQSTDEPLIVPSPVIAEMSFLIRRNLRPATLITFLDDIASGAYLIADLVPDDYMRARDLCTQYLDSDIGFVDAAILAIVERLNEPKLATLDHRHFGMMRPCHVDALRLLPD